MLIKINAIVREEKFEDVKEALNKIGVNGIQYHRLWDAEHRKVLQKLSVEQKLI